MLKLLDVATFANVSCNSSQVNDFLYFQEMLFLTAVLKGAITFGFWLTPFFLDIFENSFPPQKGVLGKLHVGYSQITSSMKILLVMLLNELEATHR